MKIATIVFIFILLLGCSQQYFINLNKESENLQGDKNITGKLFDSSGDIPLSNIKIALIGERNLITKTDSDGNFIFPHIKSGIYKIYPIIDNCIYYTSILQDLIHIKESDNLIDINIYIIRYEPINSYYNNNKYLTSIKIKDYSGNDNTIDYEKFYTISEIQGKSHYSPYKDKMVTNIIGVVSGFCKNMGPSYDKKQDIYIQSINHDLDYNTSEGLKLYTDNDLNLEIGDIILIKRGRVEENYKDPDFYTDYYTGNLSRTQLLCSKNNIIILKKTTKSPLPVVIGVDRGNIPSIVCDNAINGNINNYGREFNYEKYAIDYWESLEGMYIQINNPQVVGPTAYSSCFIVPDSSDPANRKYGKIWTKNGGILVKDYFDIHTYIVGFASLVNKDDYNWFPKLKTGSKFNSPIKGVVDYQRNRWTIYATKDSDVSPSTDNPITKEITTLSGSGNNMTIGCYNIENFSIIDQYGRSNTNKINGLANDIKSHLKYPDILALIEVQDDSSELDDGTISSKKSLIALRDAIGVIPNSGEKYVWTYIEPMYNKEGGAPGANIRIAFFYNPVRIRLAEGREKGKSDIPVDVINKNGVAELTFNPGRISPLNEAFSSTRRALAGEFIFIPSGTKFFFIGVHLSSKIGDGATFGYQQPPQRPSEVKRHKQAKIINSFINKILTIEKDANIIIAGDFNDYQYSETISIIKGNNLVNLIDLLPEDERYTYIHDGHSQTLDNILVSKNLIKKNPLIDVVRINSEFYYISSSVQPWSDHEPVLAQFTF